MSANSLRLKKAIATFAVIVAFAFTLVASVTAKAATEADLWGSWKLLGATSKDAKTGEVGYAYGGPHPTGSIMYGKDHRMIVLITFDNRIKPQSVDAATPEQRVQLFNSMIAYAGTYAIVGNAVEHYVDSSWNENRTGTTLVRYYTLEGDTLVLTTAPYVDFEGKTVIITLTFQKNK